MDKLDTSKRTAEVSSQGEEEMDHEEKVDEIAGIVGFIANKEIESMGVFDKFDKESVEKAEEYLDKLEGAIELEEEGDDIENAEENGNIVCLWKIVSKKK